MQLQAYEKNQAELSTKKTALVAISPMKVSESLKLHTKLELSYPLLSDVGNVYARELDLVFKFEEDVKAGYLSRNLNIPQFNGNEDWELPITALFLVDTHQTITYEWLESDYTKRPEPEMLLKLIGDNI